jgi:hypothetical protein
MEVRRKLSCTPTAHEQRRTSVPRPRFQHPQPDRNNWPPQISSIIGESTPPVNANLSGKWQVAIYGQGGCGVGSILATFTLNGNGGATNATETSHSAGCGDGTTTGNTFTVQSPNADGSGTAGLSCGTGCGFNYKIQVSADRTTFNLVDVSDPANYWVGTAIHQ